MASQDMNDKTQANTEKDSCSVNLAFFNFGATVYFVFTVLLTGSQDILSGTSIQTSWVLFADITPNILAIVIVPFFSRTIPYAPRVVTVFVLNMTAFSCLGLVKNVYLKLASVALVSFSMGILDSSAIALTCNFSPSILSIYSTATGAALLGATLYYIAMTTWLCVSPNITLLVLGPCSVFILISYYTVHKKINNKDQHRTATEVPYTKLSGTSDDDDDISTRNTSNKTHLVSSRLETDEEKDGGRLDDKMFSDDRLTFAEKLATTKKLFLVAGFPTIVSFVSEYLFFQSVITTLAYQNAPFPPRDHFQYYSLVLMIGEVLARGHRSVLEIVKPDWLYTPTRLSLWVLAIIEFLHLIAFVCESWYRFFPGVEVTIFLCFTAGVVVGIAYVSNLEMHRVILNEKEREFGMAMAILPFVIGIFFAALVGLYVEPALKEHCTTLLTNSDYCITRSFDLKNAMQLCKAKL